ncbi:MAG: hypothetical protein ABSH56_15135 [Bryobacteraceae bacterium]
MAFILTIRERNDSWAGRSPVASEHLTHAEAEAELLDYVQHNWDAEMETEPPDDPDDMVDEYFDAVLEVYEILETA